MQAFDNSGHPISAAANGATRFVLTGDNNDAYFAEQGDAALLLAQLQDVRAIVGPARFIRASLDINYAAPGCDDYLAVIVP